MRKIMALVLTLGCMAGLVGCGLLKNTDSSDISSAPMITAKPTSEPTESPAPEPTATPTVVPEDYVPDAIPGYTEAQSKQIRDELADITCSVPDYYAEKNYIRTRIHLMQADVTHDGIMDNIETLVYLPPESDLTLDIDTLIAQQIFVDAVWVQVYDGSTATEESLGTPIFCDEYSRCHAGNGALSVVHRDGKDYLLWSSTWEGQGAVDYSFDVLALDGKGRWYLIDHEEFHWDGERNEEDTWESLKQQIVTFKDGLAPWIENGEIVAATELDYHFITTESHPYKAHEFYDLKLK